MWTMGKRVLRYTESTAECSACRREKPKTEFSPDRRHRRGVQSVCRECVCAAATERRRMAGARPMAEVCATSHAPEKACTKCGVVRPNTRQFFSPDTRKTGVGLQARCRDCCRAWSRSARGREFGRAATKSEQARERRAAAMRRWRARNPDVVAAYYAVARAIKRGRLQRQPCVKCGTPKGEAHHHRGYAPEHRLDVEWLCKECHVVEHFGPVPQ